MVVTTAMTRSLRPTIEPASCRCLDNRGHFFDRRAFSERDRCPARSQRRESLTVRDKLATLNRSSRTERTSVRAAIDRMEGAMSDVTRRELMKGAAAAGLLAGVPRIARAQSKEPIPIGTLCPLTGAGGAYGPDMQKAIAAVGERINKSGGINGRPIQLVHEDSQTNPEAAVRAARKLIDVNHVVAILSTWASAVTLAVKPLAVEAKVFYISVSGADAVTEGNHGGYIARTQPNTRLQGQVYAKWVLSRKEWKRVAYVALQTPFAVPFGDLFMGTLKTEGVTITDNLIYEDKKP